MDTFSDVQTLLQPARFAALVARSRRNLDHSRALLLTVHATVHAVRRTRRPTFAGGTDPDDGASATAADCRTGRTLAKLRSGALPVHGAQRRWVGAGRGERCNGCGDPITPRETELELDFNDALLLRFHAPCFKAWERFDGKRP